MNKFSNTLNSPLYGRIARISRPKLLGFGRHEGVLLPDGRVVHTNADGGTKVCSFAEFSAGKVVYVEHEVPLFHHHAALRVLRELLNANAPYDLITNNCEIFSRKVALEDPVSPQLGFWVVGIICIGAWFISHRPSA
jgi:hypothetical protein